MQQVVSKVAVVYCKMVLTLMAEKGFERVRRLNIASGSGPMVNKWQQQCELEFRENGKFQDKVNDSLMYGSCSVLQIAVVSVSTAIFNPLQKKCTLLYLNTQSVPRCKHFFFISVIKTNQFML